MENVKEILVVALILYIITGVFIMLYRLLVWHSFPGLFGYTLLAALVLLKGALIGLRCKHNEEEITKTDWSKIIFLLQLSLVIFCLILFISFWLKEQYTAALISFLTLLLCTYVTRVINPFTNSNP